MMSNGLISDLRQFMVVINFYAFPGKTNKGILM